MRKHRLPTINRIACLLVILSCLACHEETVYHSYQPVDSAGWARNDTLSFVLPSSILPNDYKFGIGIRHKDSYKYRDIWLTVNHDTLHLYLADTIGNWLGNGMGEIRQLIVPFTISKHTEDSLQTLYINHIMQDRPLTGIQDIGIQIRKHP